MLTEKEESLNNIEKQIRNLPKEMQNSVIWIMKNIEIVNRLSEGEKISDMDAEKFIKLAKEKKDYFTLALILYKIIKDQNEPEER